MPLPLATKRQFFPILSGIYLLLTLLLAFYSLVRRSSLRLVSLVSFACLQLANQPRILMIIILLSRLCLRTQLAILEEKDRNE